MADKFKMGDEVKDSITGFTGVATGICDYITGCRQICVQPPVKADGDFVGAKWFDDDRLEMIQTKKHLHKVSRAGFGDAPPSK